MSYQFPALVKLTTDLLESGLHVVQSAAETAQAGLSKVTGQEIKKGMGPAPVAGPQDVDTAFSDLAGRTMRILFDTPADAAHIPTAAANILEAARRAFHFVDLKSPATLALPVQLALSATSLAAQSSLRGLVMFGVVGPDHAPTLASDFIQMFNEFPLIVGLEYRGAMDKWRARLKEVPDDHKTRWDLGDMLLKCGLYEQAVEELSKIPPSSSWHAEAIHEVAVALYRSGQFEKSMRACVAALAARPGHARTRAFLWLASQRTGGTYPDWVPSPARMTVKVGWEKPTVQFRDIAAEIGLDKTSAGRGIAIFDSNNNGYLDILIAAGHGGCNFYRNNGDGTYTDVSIASGLDKCVNGFAVTIGDYDNDGFPDVFITRLGFYAGECQLFHNNGDGTFTDVTAKAGLKVWGPSFAAAWVDYDNDGRLDLFIANNLGGLFDRKRPNRLFHNNGDGTFTEVSAKAGLNTPWPTNAGAWGDYNNDGFPDLFVSNGLGHSQLYRNNGNGTFTDVSKEAGVEALCFGSPAFWWDYDNDGWLDIAQFVWSDHEDVIHTMEHGVGPAHGNPMRVYKNNRNGTFTDVGKQIGMTGCWGTMSGNACDFNNDGYLDVVLGNGSPKMDRMDPMVVMENDGKKFRNVTFAAGFPMQGKSHGVNMGDLFGDGRMSILVAAGGAYPGDLLTTNVYCPTELPGNYLNVRLKGVKCNRSAIGARITLKAGGKIQMREISGGSNFGCLPLEQHFGLGKLESVESITVRWPGGDTEVFEDLPANKTLEFVQGQAGWTDVYERARAAVQQPG